MLVWTIIKNSFIKFYDNLFKMVFLNLIWVILILLFLFLVYGGIATGWLIPVIIPIVLMGPLTLSGLTVIDGVVEGNGLEINKFLVGIKKYFKRGLAGFLFTIIPYLILILDFYFYFQKGSKNQLMLYISVVLLYVIIFFSMVQLFFWGLLVIQRETSVIQVIKNSLLLTMDNVLFTFLWFVLVALIFIVLLITGVGIALVALVLVGFMIITGTRKILEKYTDKGGDIDG